MPNNDGGVQSAVDSAKKALSSARTFTKSATGGKDPSLFAPKAAAPVVKAAPVAAPAANVGDELKAKSDNVKQYTDAKPMGSFHTGTDYVPKTGNYTLKEGEAVVPAEKNMAKNAMAKAGKNVAAKKKKKKGAVHITPTDNDGFVVDHDSDPDSKEMTAKSGNAKHAIANVQDLVNHIQQHFGQGAADADKDDAAAQDQQAAGDAATGAADAAGPAGGAPQEA